MKAAAGCYASAHALCARFIVCQAIVLRQHTGRDLSIVLMGTIHCVSLLFSVYIHYESTLGVFSV